MGQAVGQAALSLSRNGTGREQSIKERISIKKAYIYRLVLGCSYCRIESISISIGSWLFLLSDQNYIDWSSNMTIVESDYERKTFRKGLYGFLLHIWRYHERSFFHCPIRRWSFLIGTFWNKDKGKNIIGCPYRETDFWPLARHKN